MELFKDVQVNGGIIKPGQKDVLIEWMFEEIKQNEIASYEEGGVQKYAIQPSCGCTASIEVLQDRLVAKYNDGGNSLGPLSRSLTVYLKASDGTEVFLTNDRGVKMFNPALGKVTLGFTVTVEK